MIYDIVHQICLFGLASLKNSSIYGYNINYEIDPSIKYTDIVTFLSFVLAASVFLYGKMENNRLKKKEYADNVRRSASTIFAKLERWKELNVNSFMEIQPIITETEAMIEANRDLEKFRDYFLSEISKIHSKCCQKIIDEQIEMAYKDLMGYDKNVEICFSNAINALKQIDNLVMLSLFYQIQHELEDKNLVIQGYPCRVQLIDAEGEVYKNTEIGNIFQYIVNMHRLESECLMTGIISNFNVEITKLITGEDKDVVNKKIKINSQTYETYLLKAIAGLILRLEGSQERIKGYAEKIKGNKKQSEEHITISKYTLKDSVQNYENAIKCINSNANTDIKTELLSGFYAGKYLSHRANGSNGEAKESFGKALFYYRKSRNDKFSIELTNNKNIIKEA